MFFKGFGILIIALFAINLDYGAFGAKVKVFELTNGWKLRNQNGSIELSVGKIPSGVFTALKKLHGDILHSYNDVNLRWIAYDNWTYSNSFSVNPKDYTEGDNVNLTLHGIDTMAIIRLNKHLVGNMDNMFARISFDISPYIREDNILEIELISPIHETRRRADILKDKNTPAPPDCPFEQFKGECHRNLLRKMQSSFGTDCGLAAPSMGIWKTVALEFYETAIMRDVDVAIRKNTTHWTLDVRVFLSTGLRQNFYAELTFYAADLLLQPVNISRSLVSYKSPIIEFKQEIPIEKVELWWPNGYGKQKLYPLFFSANCWLSKYGPNLLAKTVSQKSLKIGFRTIELVEDRIDQKRPGNTFFFRVNDVDIFAKGANILPINILPELTNDIDKMSHLLSSAKEAHMNMIRIWAGGLYESDNFYGLTDHYGLLVWQDMPFTSATYPINDDFVEAVRVETVRNAQRLAYHPSLAMFATNDEVEMDIFNSKYDTDSDYERYSDDFRQLFIGTVKYELNLISRSDFSPRPGPLISTPSNGMEKKELTADPDDKTFGDVHFYDDDNDSWNPDLYPRARFVSEYGFQSLPAMGAWKRILNSDDTLLELIEHRQHHPTATASVEAQVRRHLPLLLKDDKNYIDALIYFSQISQAMSTKVGTEVFRCSRYSDQRTMGALLWQLNDVWIAPTRSMIDFYGNYKLVYYWAKEFLSPTAIIALYDSKSSALNVTIVRDDIDDAGQSYEVNMYTYLWSDIYPKHNVTWQTKVRGSGVAVTIFPMDTIFDDRFTIKNSLLEFTLSSNQKIVSRTFFIPGNITQVVGLRDPHLKYEISKPKCDPIIPSYTITIRIEHPALFVYIEIDHPDVKKYKLSDNGFIQVEPVKSVHLDFEPVTKCITISHGDVKIKTVNQYMIN